MKNIVVKVFSIILFVLLMVIIVNFLENRDTTATYKIDSLEWPFQNMNYCGVEFKQKGLKVAIIDSGIDKSLSVFKNLNIKEYNIDPSQTDKHNSIHGTLVSSIISNNKIISDKDLGHYIDFINIKIGNDGKINIDSLIKGINLAVSLNADIINISVGTYKNDPNLEKVISEGIKQKKIFVCASGNDGTEQYLYPASYNGVISVSSTDANDNYLANNNRNDKIVLAAPGEKIPTYINNKGYQKYLSGSSSSTAIVTDAIVILKEIRSSLESNDIINIFKNSCKDLGSKGKDNYYGYGMIDYEKAIMYTFKNY